MKKIFLIVAISGLSISGFAQKNKCENLPADYTYCVVEKHGTVYLKRDGVKHEEDIKLANGNLMRAEGVIETKDRFIVLQPDQCIYVEGKLEDNNEEPITSNK